MNIEKEKVAKTSLSIASVVEMFRNMVVVAKLAWQESHNLVILMFAVTLAMTLLSFLRSGANALVVNELMRASRYGQFTLMLTFSVGLLMFAYALPSLLHSLKRYWEKALHMVMSERFEMMMLKKRSELDLARHEDPAFQDLSNKAGERGIFSLINLLEGQYDMLSSVAGLVIASAILLSIDSTLWLMVAFGEIPSLIAQFRYSHNVWDIYDTQSTTRRRFFHLRNKFQSSSNLFELQVFQNVGHFITRVESMLKGFNAEHRVNDKKKFRADLISGMVSTLAISLTVLIVIMRVVSGETQIGTWLFITGTLFSFQSSFSGLFNTLARQYENSLFASDIRKVLATEPVIKQPENGIVVCRGKIPTIEFRNVTFTYPDQSEPVLRNVSLTIKPGEILAIVGENGAGKTTLAKLLCRVYDPDKGKILIDGIDLKTIDLQSWYAELAILAQWYGEYCFKADEVIALGRTTDPIRRERVLESAKFSGADRFIEKFDEGYSQQIGREFGGIDLSRGQSQRLVLARVSYRKAHFAILDEPTAATDAKAEAAIFERLYSLKGKTSAVLISHNYANVVQADRICVLENGSVAEIGSHAALMRQGGIYARLFRLQADRFQ
ncbi:MAG: ABC transporter ATP-binding protein [Candidatus Paceibacterota bacterium]|jgi:ATP-binding cassette subfamily B protein